MNQQLFEEPLTKSVVGAFFQVYNVLGFGFLERIYVQALIRELLDRGHTVAQQMSVSVYYKGVVVGTQRMDLVVDDKLVIEAKSNPKLDPVAERQLLNYLRATEFELGLLLHFGEDAKCYRRIHENKYKPHFQIPREKSLENSAQPRPDNDSQDNEHQNNQPNDDLLT